VFWYPFLGSILFSSSSSFFFFSFFFFNVLVLIFFFGEKNFKCVFNFFCGENCLLMFLTYFDKKEKEKGE
jgi:hypothetical protein